jgi:hypothetical protein
MKMRSDAVLTSRIERVLRLFSYILLGAPDFPAEDETDVDKEIARLLEQLAGLREHIQDVERRDWIDLAMGEVKQARRLFQAGDESVGKRELTAAEEHFKSWVARTRAEPAFVVDPDGKARKL